MGGDHRIESMEATAYRIPTERMEGDGTYAWDATTLVAVQVAGAGRRGFGYSYGSSAMVPLIREMLAQRVVGADAMSVEACWNAMVHAVRNVGRGGVAATAISAVDAALWDLKAKLLDLPLVDLLGGVRNGVHVYGSGGFTSDPVPALVRQLEGWVEAGIGSVKMKIGSHPAQDVARVRAARRAIGDDVALMVDANGAYRVKEALAKAEAFAGLGVTWFEEPVSSDDLEGLCRIKDRGPAGMEIAAGEYGYEPLYFRRMLEAGAVDVLQADATRCLGITGFMATSRLCQVFGVPLSAHTAPSVHAHVACAVTGLRHLEYFYDHVRIERMLFDGFLAPKHGVVVPERDRPGLGVELKELDAAHYAA